jgi:phage baseplate assembly protein W
MANGTTYGINFPFRNSLTGNYLDLSETKDEEVRTNLIHLLLTRKGSRYFLPDFGTRLYEYIFEPLDGPTFSEIDAEIRQSAEKYIPGVKITMIDVFDASTEYEDSGTVVTNGQKEFKVTNISEKEHTAKVKIDYIITDGAFESSDFIIINI